MRHHQWLQQGTLTVNKIVVNDHGGTKTVEDFSFSVDGATAVTEPEASSDGYTTTYSELRAKDAYGGGRNDLD